MKNSKYIFIGIIAIFIIGGIVFFIFKNNSNNISNKENNTTEYARTSVEDNTVNNTETENTNQNSQENTAENETNNNTVETQITEPPSTPTPPVEEDLSSFSTRIYSKDSNRQNNLKITSATLNGKTVEAGKTFSFTQTIGKSTPQKGYKEADIYDKDGNKIKGYGGGNCQISSTLYNAVLALPSLNVTERHPHSKKVPYVKEGKDAAVAYGSVDFKFVNNYDFPIKIYCTVDSKNVTVRIVKIS